MTYPNLELLEYVARDILKEKGKSAEEISKIEFRADVFTQTWGSTALGFGGIGGQMMTDAYTTIMGNEQEEIFVVFFDSRPAYLVECPKDQFYEDLKNRHMVAVNESFSRY